MARPIRLWAENHKQCLARLVSDRKQQILTTAAQILEHKSFAAFSYQDLADELVICKAIIHHHFATKDELGAALRQSTQTFMAKLGELLEGARTGGEIALLGARISEPILGRECFRGIVRQLQRSLGL